MLHIRRTVAFALPALAWLILLTGCANEAPRLVPVPTLEATALSFAPTPTLVPGAPTPPLPTPLITRQQGEMPVAPTAVAPSVTPSPTLTPGPTLTPSATPPVAERLALAETAVAYGDFASAAEQYSAVLGQEPALGPQAQNEALYRLGVAYFEEGAYGDAVTIFNQLLGLAG